MGSSQGVRSGKVGASHFEVKRLVVRPSESPSWEERTKISVKRRTKNLLDSVLGGMYPTSVQGSYRFFPRGLFLKGGREAM